MVSVWMITYNHDKYITDAIEGVLKQKTTFKFDLIIGEDGSTDNTAPIVQKYAELYPDMIKARFNKSNIGMMPNMIKTLQECSGKYIALCEGDDYWTDPLKLQTQVEFLEANQDCIACYHDAIIIDSAGNITSESKLPENCRRDYTSEELMKGAWILTLSMVFRNVLKEYPSEILGVSNGDTFLTVLLGAHGKGKYLDRIQPAVYRQHEGGVWSGLDIDSKKFLGFNSCLLIYQYHLKSTGRQFAINFLFDVLYSRFRELFPERNPFAMELRERDLREERTRVCLRDLSNSHTYRVGAFILWPFKRVKAAIEAVIDGFNNRR